MNTNLTSITSCRSLKLTGTLCVMAALSLQESAEAKVSVKKVTPPTVCQRDGLGTQRDVNRLCCQGYPVLITEDSEGKTQVYVNDGTAPTNPTLTQQEAYRVEDVEDWTKIQIFAGGDASEREDVNLIDVNVEMTGGTIGALTLAGYTVLDIIHDATLRVTGGSIYSLSVIGRKESCVKGSVNISLYNMTYTGGVEMRLYKDIDPNGGPVFEEVNCYIDPSCTFMHPELNPNYQYDTEHYHDYYIQSVTPDQFLSEAGELTIACRSCDEVWSDIKFSKGGWSDEIMKRRGTTNGYSYHVQQLSTIKAPTCVPGLGLFLIVLYWHDLKEPLTATFESPLPPVDGAHDWDENGRCRNGEHLKIQRNGNGGAMTDENGNLIYIIGLDGKPETDNTPVRATSASFVRSGIKRQYLSDGVPMYIDNEELTYEDWTTQNYPSFQRAVTSASTPGRAPETTIVGTFQDATLDNLEIGWSDKEFTIELYGHTLNIESSYEEDQPKLRAECPLTLSNGTVNADIYCYQGGGELKLRKATVNSKEIMWKSDCNIVLTEGSHLNVDGELQTNGIEIDNTSSMSASIDQINLNPAFDFGRILHYLADRYQYTPVFSGDQYISGDKWSGYYWQMRQPSITLIDSEGHEVTNWEIDGAELSDYEPQHDFSCWARYSDYFDSNKCMAYCSLCHQIDPSQIVANAYALHDGEPYYRQEEVVENCNVLYDRTFNHTKWQALFIPFSLNYDEWKDDFEIARINNMNQYDTDDDGYEDMTVMEVFKVKDYTLPHTPYLIRALKPGKMTLIAKNTTLYPCYGFEPHSVSSWNTVFTFGGTYSFIDGEEMMLLNLYAMGGGQLVQAEDSNSNLPPFRWFMRVTDRNGDDKNLSRVRISVHGEDGIEDISELQIELNDSTDIIDYTGRKVSSAANGLYLMHGRKVLVK